MSNHFFKSILPRSAMVNHITQAGDAFARDEDNNQIYINRTLQERFPLEIGDIVFVKVIHNHPEHAARCPYKAIYVRVTDAISDQDTSHDQDTSREQDVSHEQDVTSQVRQLLHDNEMMSTGDVAAEIGMTSTNARNLLDSMHRNGDVVRADVYVHANQSKASRSVWAVEDVIFSPVEG